MTQQVRLPTDDLLVGTDWAAITLSVDDVQDAIHESGVQGCRSPPGAQALRTGCTGGPTAVRGPAG